MCLVSKFVAIVVLISASTVAFASRPALRVCSDPNNLPFSNMQEQGFENVLAHMVARDLHRGIQFVWWPARARFVEKRLKAQMCDLVMGITSSFDLMVPTRPYYRSGYVFVSRQDRNIHVASLTDASLKNYRIGVHVIGDDAETVPPGQELAHNGFLKNIVGFSLYGHPLAPNPSAEIITAVERGDIDLAVAWGPMAGYFAKLSPVELKLTAICAPADAAALPEAFSISMGVRRGDDQLLKQLNDFIVAHDEEIQKLLRAYGVPLLNLSDTKEQCR
jgi:mxaJ protein